MAREFETQANTLRNPCNYLGLGQAGVLIFRFNIANSTQSQILSRPDQVDQYVQQAWKQAASVHWVCSVAKPGGFI